MQHSIMYYLVLAGLLIIWAYVLSGRGDRKPMPQPKYNVPQDGMIGAFKCIVRNMFSDTVNPSHLKQIHRMIGDFKTKFAYNQDMEEYHTELKQQYRILSERLLPEGTHAVAHEVELQDMVN